MDGRTTYDSNTALCTTRTSRGKNVANFLLVINSNIGPMLPRLRDIIAFLLRRATLRLLHPNFAGVPPVLDRRYCSSEERKP